MTSWPHIYCCLSRGDSEGEGKSRSICIEVILRGRGKVHLILTSILGGGDSEVLVKSWPNSNNYLCRGDSEGMSQSWPHINSHFCRGHSEGYMSQSGPHTKNCMCDGILKGRGKGSWPHINGRLWRGDSEEKGKVYFHIKETQIKIGLSYSCLIDMTHLIFHCIS